MRPIATEYTGFRALTEDTIADIKTKDRTFRTLRESHSFRKLEVACDLYVSAFLLPKIGGAPASRGSSTIPTTSDVWQALDDGEVWGPLIGRAEIARRAHAFHWPLEFPDVMQRGGFDVVLGNPPWERIKLQEQEFFAARSPEIAGAPNKAARDRLIRALAAAPEGSAEHALFDAFTFAKREAEANSEFVRVAGEEGGRFALTGTGDVNTYGLFAELFLRLTKDHAGIVIPTGVATDSTYANFFSYIVRERRLSQLIDFENRAGLFPAVDSRMKFCLLTLGRDEAEARFAFFLTAPAQLSEPERNFTLSPEAIAKLNPNTGTAPVLRTRADAEITAKIYSASPILVPAHDTPSGDNWQVRLRTLFHKSKAAQDGHIQPAIEADLNDPDWEPAYEGDYGHQYDHRFGTFEHGAVRDVTLVEHGSPNFEPEFEWVGSRQEFQRKMEYWGVPLKRSAFLAFRRVARSTDERTSLAAMIPFRSVTNSWILVLDPEPKAQAALCGAMNSLVLDYCLRNSLSQPSIPQNVYEQLPVPRPSRLMAEPCLAFIVPKVLELTYTSHNLASFARDLGYDGPPFVWDEDRRAQLRGDLDAFYARAYGLDREELLYILDPADVKGPDYPSETFRVLKDKEIRAFGEYRTRRLVLEAWDRMEADGTFAELGLGANHIADSATVLQKPALATLPDDAWIRAAQQPYDAGTALAAILKAVTGPTPSRTVRLAAAMMLEPHLLTSLLSEEKAREWRRLVGQEAEPRTGNVVGFAARINQGWGTAVANHRGNGRLIENLTERTWAPGSGLDAFETAGWPDGRADFVLEALAVLDLNTTVNSMPDEVRGWITHVAAA